MLTQYPPAEAQAPQKENILLGTLLALVAIPVGIVAWVFVWSLGYIAAIVAAGIALLVMFMYRLGAKRISIIGVIIIAVISLATVVIAFYAGLVHDYTSAVSNMYGLSYWQVLTTPGFLSDAMSLVTMPEVFAEVQGDFWMSLGFGALGVLPAVMAAFRESKGLPAFGETPQDTQQPAPQTWGVESVAGIQQPGTPEIPSVAPEPPVVDELPGQPDLPEHPEPKN